VVLHGKTPQNVCYGGYGITTRLRIKTLFPDVFEPTELQPSLWVSVTEPQGVRYVPTNPTSLFGTSFPKGVPTALANRDFMPQSLDNYIAFIISCFITQAE
jgi:hypothetical protein